MNQCRTSDSNQKAALSRTKKNNDVEVERGFF